MRRPAAIALLSFALLGLAGCKGSCRQLSEKLCDCSTNSVERELCVRRAANDQAVVEPTAEDEATCDVLLKKAEDDSLKDDEKCTCNNYQTDEGKQLCGLAR